MNQSNFFFTHSKLLYLYGKVPFCIKVSILIALPFMEQLKLIGSISAKFFMNNAVPFEQRTFWHEAIDTGAGALSPGYRIAPNDIHVVMRTPARTPQ